MNTIAETSGTNIAPLLLSAIVIGLLFFLMIVRPQKRNVARHQQLIAALKPGDEVITSGGIYGQIISIDTQEQSVMLKIATGVEVKMAMRALAMKKSEPVPEPVDDSTED